MRIASLEGAIVVYERIALMENEFELYISVSDKRTLCFLTAGLCVNRGPSRDGL